MAMVEFDDHSPENQAALLRYISGEAEPRASSWFGWLMFWLAAGGTAWYRIVRKLLIVW